MTLAAESALYERAECQHGFFTSGQAIAAGYADNVHVYHVRVGNWERVYRGIYRLARFPHDPRPELAVALLWTRNRAGEFEGVFSHWTAFELWRGQVDSRAEGQVHLTVPRRFRRNSSPPPGVALHKADLAEGQVRYLDGYPVTERWRTVSDMAYFGIETSDLRSDSEKAAHMVRESPAGTGTPHGGTGTLAQRSLRRGTGTAKVKKAGAETDAGTGTPARENEWGGARSW